MTPIGKFYDEITEYLDSKIPDVPVAVRKEIAVWVAGMVIVREKDIVEETVEMVRANMKGSTRSRREVMERNKLLAEARREEIERSL